MIREVSLKECGCKIVNLEHLGRALKATEIRYCPKHRAADDMYEALKGLALAYNIDEHSVIVNQDPHYWQQALNALTKAEGR